jgi:uncharacterized protein
VNPFYFGRAESPLYGVYHPPQGRKAVGAVVLCYPIGGEYMRAHRAFRQLTNFLVRGGFHVLRFDYFGTGDSSGTGVEATLPSWLESIRTTIEEMKDSAGVERVSLVGLRFGASMALLASRDRDDVKSVVLWDPVLDGARYLADSLTSDNEAESVEDENEVEADGLPPGTVGMGGFPLTPRLQEELSAVDLTHISAPDVGSLDWVVSSENEAVRAIVSGWKALGVPASYRCFPSEGDWAKGDRFGSALIPQAIIKGVVDVLGASLVS